jgi:uncharacterized protein
MFFRQLSDKITQVMQTFPVIAVVGPRQSGKTTLCKNSFKEHKYVSLEDLDMREFAHTDPRGFLRTFLDGQGVIIDEIQHVPELVSYLQTYVDEHPVFGRIIITGSQNFLISEKIAQTLAGRVAIFHLLPLSFHELKIANRLPDTMEEAIFNGFYPAIYTHKELSLSSSFSPSDWYINYIRTYVERDVRQIKNITDLFTFQKFLKLCAGRIGQVLNLSSLAQDAGISVNTAKGWLSLLETSFITFTLQPYYKKFSKRLIKAPKLYFYDTGLACSLLGIENSSQVATHYLKGGLFESMILTELLKQRYNAGKTANIYFWRDHSGHEVDALLDYPDRTSACEIKASSTISSDFFSGLKKWEELVEKETTGSLKDAQELGKQEIIPKSAIQKVVIYAGEQTQHRSTAHVLSWQDSDNLNSDTVNMN